MEERRRVLSDGRISNGDDFMRRLHDCLMGVRDEGEACLKWKDDEKESHCSVSEGN